MEKYSLGGKWSLYYCKDKDFKGFDGNVEELGNFDRISAEVPGNVELDLSRAKVMPKDLFFGENILKCRETEDVHFFYVRKFKKKYERETLVFDGVDTFADVYLNGKKIAALDNMLIAHEVPLSGEKTENELVVHIRPTIVEAKKYPPVDPSRFLSFCSDAAYVRKAIHSFGWDILPRAVSAGIWKDVYLRKTEKAEIKDVFLHTLSLSGNSARVAYEFEFRGEENCEYTLSAVCGESTFSASGKISGGKTAGEITVKDAKLWFPKNYGEQNLYDVTITAEKDGIKAAEKKLSFGVRTVTLDRTSVVDETGGKFCFYVNGKRIFVLGTNWVALSAFHSLDEKRLDKAFDLLVGSNCNAVRCWGGNVYESDRFFDLCDKNGILIWQDFSMACGIYPQDELFAEKMKTEVESVVKRLRNHPALALWAGDNECDFILNFVGDPNDNSITRKLIPDILSDLDDSRPYLPSSPYIDDEAYSTKKPTTEQHTWGDRTYFKGDYYANTVCNFVSEIGFPAMPKAESLKKFISKDKLWPWKDEKQFEDFKPREGDFLYNLNKDKANDEWLLHGTALTTTISTYSFRVPLLAYSARLLFGDKDDTLETFIFKSQCVQAEAYKYSIERYRLAKWNKTGIIWWNLIEGWPSIADCVVDYYYNKKLAYEYITRAQRPLHVAFAEPANEKHDVVAINDSQSDEEFDVVVTKLATREVIFKKKAVCKANDNLTLGTVPEGEKAEIYIIKFKAGGKEYFSHYVRDLRGSDIKAYAELVKELGFSDYVPEAYLKNL